MKLIVTLISILALTACQSTDTKVDTTIDADNSNANQTATIESTTESPDESDILICVGKSWNEIKKEHPKGGVVIDQKGLSDAVAICYGNENDPYLYYFFGVQTGDHMKVINKFGDDLRCAGIITTTEILFPSMLDEMTFDEFFAMIGVSEYEYDPDDGMLKGLLFFTYKDMRVTLNINEIDENGVWMDSEEQVVKKTSIMTIYNKQTIIDNYALFKTVNNN